MTVGNMISFPGHNRLPFHRLAGKSGYSDIENGGTMLKVPDSTRQLHRLDEAL
jgi:hypothetical protein